MDWRYKIESQGSAGKQPLCNWFFADIPLKCWNPMAVTKLVNIMHSELLPNSRGVPATRPKASYRNGPWANNVGIKNSESILKTSGCWLSYRAPKFTEHWCSSFRRAGNVMKLFLSDIVKKGLKDHISDAIPVGNWSKVDTWDCFINLPEWVWYTSSAISCVSRFPLQYLHYWANTFLLNYCCLWQCKAPCYLNI